MHSIKIACVYPAIKGTEYNVTELKCTVSVHEMHVYMGGETCSVILE